MASDQPQAASSSGPGVAPTEDDPPINYDAKFEDYEIKELIGRGSYSATNECIDVSGKRFAIKKMAHEVQNTKVVSVCRNEIKVLAELRHPNIVRLWAVIKETNYTSLILDRMKCSLAFHVDQSPRLDLKTQKLIQYQTLQAICYCHSSGYIHRDIKPGNILVDEKFGVKLCDFGLATRFDKNHDHLTQSSETVGTKSHIPPETYENRKNYFSSATDIWAAGCSFFEMATKHILFDRACETRFEKIVYIRSKLPEFKIDEFDVNTVDYTLRRYLDREGVGIIVDMLKYNYEKRPKAKQLLRRHYYRDVDRSALLAPNYTGD